MANEATKNLTDLAEVFNALGHPTRSYAKTTSRIRCQTQYRRRHLLTSRHNPPQKIITRLAKQPENDILFGCNRCKI